MRQPNGQDHNEGRRRRSKRGGGIAGDNQVDFVCQIHAEVAQEPQNLRECAGNAKERRETMNENADGKQEKSGGSSMMGGFGCKMWAMTLPARDTPQRLRSSSGSSDGGSDGGSKVALKNPTLEWPSVRQTTASDPNDKPS